jgi:hypothetical protein
MSDSFVHLHVHTEFSMLDGAARIGELFDETVRHEMPALAMTDHGNVFGAFEFYKAAKASSRSSAPRPTSRPAPAGSRSAGSSVATAAPTTSPEAAPTRTSRCSPRTPRACTTCSG